MKATCSVILTCAFSTSLFAQTTTTSNSVAMPSAPPPALPASEALKRMVPLFDGKTLHGWECDTNAWSVRDGALHGAGKYGQVFTKTDYANFRLLVTARVVTPEINTGNGHLGVLFWGDRPAAGTWGTAGALQVQPPHGAMWDYRINKNVNPARVVPKQGLLYHDWHTSEILANLRTGAVRMAVDGLEIIQYRHPNPALLKKGPIGMQLHSAASVVEYRDIRIEEDPKEDKLITVK